MEEQPPHHHLPPQPPSFPPPPPPPPLMSSQPHLHPLPSHHPPACRRQTPPRSHLHSRLPASLQEPARQRAAPGAGRGAPRWVGSRRSSRREYAAATRSLTHQGVAVAEEATTAGTLLSSRTALRGHLPAVQRPERRQGRVISHVRLEAPQPPLHEPRASPPSPRATGARGWLHGPR